MKRALLVLALLAAASVAPAQDLLSGEYRPKDPADGETPLRVEREGDGWTAWFNGEARPLDPASGAQLGALFPGLDEASHPQCGVSAKLLLCHVDRGTRFEDAGFTATTGYFALFVDGGAFELVRQPDADAAD
jgi:hypothetical protein